MKVFTKMILISSLSAVFAQAMVLGGSNLGMMGYDSHSCGYKPDKPYKPFSFSNQYEVDNYNNKVETYNSEIDTYITCIQEYIENADNDINRIIEARNEAIREAKR